MTTYRTAVPRPTLSVPAHGTRTFTGAAAEALAVYLFKAWTLMLLFGGLHSWQPAIPAAPFWPMLGLLYLLGSVIGFVLWVTVRYARSLADRP